MRLAGNTQVGSMDVTLPANALENVILQAATARPVGWQHGTDSMSDFTGASLGRDPALPCSKRTIWNDQVMVHVVHQQGSPERSNLSGLDRAGDRHE